jgi:hypothetical protein
MKSMVDCTKLSEMEYFEVVLLADAIYGAKDILFIKKYYNKLKALELCLQQIKQDGFSPENRGPYFEIKIINLHMNGLGTGHYWFGSYSKYGNKSLLKRYPARQRSRRVPKRYIGVGYRDKGNRKNTAVDGTPCWKEVYVHLEKDQMEDLEDWQKRAFVAKYGGFYRVPWAEGSGEYNMSGTTSQQSTSQEFHEMIKRRY